MFEVLVRRYTHGNSIENIAQPRSFLYLRWHFHSCSAAELGFLPRIKIWPVFRKKRDIVPEEKAGFSRSQWMKCSK